MMSKNVMYLIISMVLLGWAGQAIASLGNDPELIIYYSYDEFTDVVPDLSGRGHNGEVKGTVTCEPESGMYKGAAKFETGSYLDLAGADMPTEDIPTAAMTLAAWAQCENTGGDHAVFNARASDSTWLVHPEFKSGGNFRWLLRSAGGTSIFDIRAGSVEWDEWMHYAGTYDSAKGKAVLYINGIVEYEQGVTGSPQIAGDWDMGARVGYNIDNARPFTGLMDDFCIFKRALSLEEVLSLMAGVGERGPAFDPIPEDESVDVARDVVLTWSAGPEAETHDIYLGTVFDDVNDASRDNPLGVLVSEGQADITYPVGVLEFSQTYYWRVDEVNAAPDFGIHKGAVWSFTTEPLAYPIENVTATTNLINEANYGPEKAVDGSGLNADGEHSNAPEDMWLGVSADEEPMWIQFEFDQVYQLHEIDVWNYNGEFETILGFGLKEVTVEYSVDGVEWTLLQEAELARGTSLPTCTANTAIDASTAAAQYVKFTIQSGYSISATEPQYGLSEVQFMYIPTQARLPEPADGATAVATDATLSWRAGREAASHDVYLDSDAQAVTDGTAPLNTVATASYTPGSLDYGTTYYWIIDEVNQAATVTLWSGSLWSFTTQEYGVVDDFEAYDDEENRIYSIWADGWVNDTGATVGYFEEPFAETKIVHGGKQAMPLEYLNSEAPFYSEASLSWSETLDWSVSGIDTLRLYVQGEADNDAETLYVGLSDASGAMAFVSHNDPDLVLATEWQEWAIPLDQFSGVDLSRIETVYIGLGDRDNPQSGGSGLIYVDDIEVGHPAAN